MTKKTRRAKTRKALLALSLVLVTMMVAVSGTIAWLTADTDQIVNTFTPTDINIKLEETTGQSYTMVPGSVITKDPAATVLATTTCGDVYLFVKVVKSENFDDYMSFTVDSAWNAVTGQDGLYYMEVASANFGTAYPIIEGNKVTVLSTVDKVDMTAAVSNQPTLTFDSFAIQKANVSLEEATTQAIAALNQ